MILITELSLRGAVTVLDGGNCFRPYWVTQLLRGKTVDIAPASKHLFVRRAFTCYEMNSLLTDTPALPQPYIVLNLLNTFYDDHVPAHEVRRLLDSCLKQIERLLLSGTVVVTLTKPSVKERTFLFETICRKADEILIEKMPVCEFIQPSLF